MANKIECTLQFTKSTKGTHVYTDTTPSAPVPSLYIKRDAIDGLPATTVKITLEF